MMEFELILNHSIAIDVLYNFGFVSVDVGGNAWPQIPENERWRWRTFWNIGRSAWFYDTRLTPNDLHSKYFS